MTSTAKSILGVVPGLEATALALSVVPKKDAFKIKPKKHATRKQIKTMVRGATGIMIGIPFVNATSSMIGKLK